MQNLDSLLKPIRNSADWVGLKFFSEKTIWRSLRNESPDRNATEWDTGIRIEVLIDGQFGYAGTTDLSPEGIQKAFVSAKSLAQAASKHKVFNYSRLHRPPAQGQYKSQIQKSLDHLGVKEMIDVLRDCSLAMKVSDKIITRSVDAMIVETQIASVSSTGEETQQDFSMVSLSFGATASQGFETQTRTQNGGFALCYQIGSEIFSRHRLLGNCKLMAEQALELVSAENCPTETTDLLLAPDQMMLQIHESIGHPLELDRILGDERNYAGWSFVQVEDFGKLQYGSPLMNVVFEPERMGSLASYAFDEGGSRASREYLIQDGLLVRGLGGTESQVRSGLQGVANFRSSSWNRPPIDRMANINLEAGTTPLEDMIASVERGVLMQANRSWSIDDYRNKFQFGCEYGQLIEEGRVTKILKNPNYRGVTVPFWNKLKMLSQTTETYGTPWCGKGEPSQLIRVGHSSPYCLFSDIEVFGG